MGQQQRESGEMLEASAESLGSLVVRETPGDVFDVESTLPIFRQRSEVPYQLERLGANPVWVGPLE